MATFRRGAGHRHRSRRRHAIARDGARTFLYRGRNHARARSYRQAWQGGPPRQQHVRALSLPAGPGQRSGVLAGARPLPGIPRWRAQLFSRERHRRLRALSIPARRCRDHGTRRAGVRDLQPVPGTQPRADQARAGAARSRAEFHDRRDFRVRPQGRALGGESCGARRALEKARKERRRVADARRQDVARGAGRAA